MSRVVLVGGGTAGHVEPALAVGRYLKSKSQDIELEFIGTKSGVEVELLVDTGIKFHSILKVQFPRKLNFKTLFWPFRFIYACLQSFVAIRGVNVIIGFGGYVSAPVYLAAKIAKIPLIIHEANAKPGLANRFGARFTDNLFIGFEGARSLGGKWVNAMNIGIPIKERIDDFGSIDRVSLRKEFLESLNLDINLKTLLIFGGSTGARQINEAVAEALPKLLNQRWNLIHAVGSANSTPEPVGTYRPIPYISDMTSAYAAADFVISRSGAVTCAELEAVGVPALLVPLEIGNGEQVANAAELLKTGQARLVKNSDFTAEWLANNLEKILGSTVHRPAIAPRKAAEKIGNLAIEIIGVNS